MNLRTRATLPPNVATILGEEVREPTQPEPTPAEPAAVAPVVEVAPPVAVAAPAEGAPVAGPAAGAGEPTPFDPLTSEVDDPIFKAEEIAGPGLTREQMVALPDEVKRTLAHMRRDYTRKTQAVAERDRALTAREQAIGTREAEPAAPAAPVPQESRTLEAALADTNHAPLQVLLGKSEEWKHLPLPEKLPLDELADEDLYDPAKLRTAMRESIDVATRARLRDGFKALLSPFEQEQAKRAEETRKTESRAAAKKWMSEHPGMDVREHRQEVFKLADGMGGGADGLDRAYRVWRSENPDKAKAAPSAAPAAPAAPAPVAAPAAPAPAAPAVAPVTESSEVERLKAENQRLREKARQAPIDIARELAAGSVGKGGSGPTGHLPRMPDGLTPMERAAWLRDHPEVAQEVRAKGLRGLSAMRESGRV